MKSPCKDCKNQEYCNKSQYCKDYIEWKKKRGNMKKQTDVSVEVNELVANINKTIHEKNYNLASLWFALKTHISEIEEILDKDSLDYLENEFEKQKREIFVKIQEK